GEEQQAAPVRMLAVIDEITALAAKMHSGLPG
ncbi:hypothetical protein SEEM0055_05751, partial [Salmonella enterica subsp. enterica serovar Montevideo str. MB110209-0055]